MSLRFKIVFALAAAGLASSAAAQQGIADVRQGTNISVALSPSGELLVTDLLGGLWQLPVAGGGAAPLIPPGQSIAQPRFSPDGTRLVMQRYAGGQWDLWLMALDSGELSALTQTAYDERQAEFSANGDSVVFTANRNGQFALWSLHLSSGVLTQLTDEPGESFYPSISDRGELAYVNYLDGRWSLRRLDGGSRGTELLNSRSILSAPSWRPGGGVIVYGERDSTRASRLMMLLIADEPVVRELTRNEDVFVGRPAWASASEYFYTADGQIWKRTIAGFSRQPVHMFAGVSVDLGEAYSFDMPLDAPGPYPVRGITGLTAAPGGRRAVFTALGDLWLSERRGLMQLTDDAYVDIDPSFSPVADRIVFASDRAGKLDLWQMQLDSGATAQLSFETGKATRPSWDPDGRLIAYLQAEGLSPWTAHSLRLLDVAGSGDNRLLTERVFDPRTPRWQVQDGEPQIQLAARYGTAQAPLMIRSFDIGGNLLATAELSPAADQTASLEVAAPALEWSQQAANQPYVIQVGRLFDGVRNGYLRHMDVHVEGQRITAIVGRDVRPLPEKVIDARDATLIPGLIDVHAHHSSLAGGRLGRMWLSHGVTTVRELTDDVAAALERAEAWASGRRLGPSLVISPEAGASSMLPQAPAPLIVLDAGSRLSSGLAHDLLQQATQLGHPALPAFDLLTGFISGSELSWLEELRVSPLLQSYQDTLSTMITSRRFLTTGLAAAAGIALPRVRVNAERAYRLLFSPEERDAWQTRHDSASTQILRPLQNTLARLVRTGSPVVTGSDAPAVPYGYGLHLELELLTASDIGTDQVLRLATAQAAMALGLDAQTGTVEAGKIADLVLLDGDPLARITDSLNIIAVVSRGRWIDRDELLRP